MVLSEAQCTLPLKHIFIKLIWHMNHILKPCTSPSQFSSSCVDLGHTQHVLPRELLWSFQTDFCTVLATGTYDCSRLRCRRQDPSLVCVPVTRQWDSMATLAMSAVPAITHYKHHLLHCTANTNWTSQQITLNSSTEVHDATKRCLSMLCFHLFEGLTYPCVKWENWTASAGCSSW